MSAKGRIINTTPRNFLRDRVLRYVRVVPAGGKVKDPGSFHRYSCQPKPLCDSSGPGSIHADSEIFALIRAGKPQEALKLFEAHQDRTHKSGAWKRSKAILWASLYKVGDPRAMGVV